MAVRSRPGVLVVGESLVDITCVGDRQSVHPGGSPLNVAVGLSRLGVPTTLATQLGSDAHGDLIRRHLAASAVTLTRLGPSGPSGPTGTATARLDSAGAASYSFDLRWDPKRAVLPPEVDHLHVGSLGAILAPGADAVADLARDARESGSSVSLDPNIRADLTPDLAQVRRRVSRLVAVADVVKLSDEDAGALFPGRSHDDVLDDLLASGAPRLAVMTLASAGALLATASARVSVAAPPIRLVDTIGAGDSFMAALLTTLRETGPPADRESLLSAGSFACRAAAISCSRAGADPPWRAELAATTAAAPSTSYPDR